MPKIMATALTTLAGVALVTPTTALTPAKPGHSPAPAAASPVRDATWGAESSPLMRPRPPGWPGNPPPGRHFTKSGNGQYPVEWHGRLIDHGWLM